MRSLLRRVANIGRLQSPPISLNLNSISWPTRLSNFESNWRILRKIPESAEGSEENDFRQFAGLFWELKDWHPELYQTHSKISQPDSKYTPVNALTSITLLLIHLGLTWKRRKGEFAGSPVSLLDEEFWIANDGKRISSLRCSQCKSRSLLVVLSSNFTFWRLWRNHGTSRTAWQFGCSDCKSQVSPSSWRPTIMGRVSCPICECWVMERCSGAQASNISSARAAPCQYTMCLAK